MEEKLNNLSIENFVWVIYIIISISAIISNKYEKEYLTKKDKTAYRKFHDINKTIFTVAIIIYIYFIYVNSQDKNNKYYTLSIYAGILFFVGGIINLYVETKSTEEEPIGFI